MTDAAPRQAASRMPARLASTKPHFLGLVQSGISIPEACEVCHISINTGRKWAKDANVTKSNDQSKQGAISALRAKLYDPKWPAAYYSATMTLLARLEGWLDDKAQAQVLKPIGVLFAEWAAENNPKPDSLSDAGQLRQSDANHPGEPPKVSGDEGVNISPTPPHSDKSFHLIT